MTDVRAREILRYFVTAWHIFSPLYLMYFPLLSLSLFLYFLTRIEHRTWFFFFYKGHINCCCCCCYCLLFVYYKYQMDCDQTKSRPREYYTLTAAAAVNEYKEREREWGGMWAKNRIQRYEKSHTHHHHALSLTRCIRFFLFSCLHKFYIIIIFFFFQAHVYTLYIFNVS